LWCGHWQMCRGRWRWRHGILAARVPVTAPRDEPSPTALLRALTEGTFRGARTEGTLIESPPRVLFVASPHWLVSQGIMLGARELPMDRGGCASPPPRLLSSPHRGYFSWQALEPPHRGYFSSPLRGYFSWQALTGSSPLRGYFPCARRALTEGTSVPPTEVTFRAKPSPVSFKESRSGHVNYRWTVVDVSPDRPAFDQIGSLLRAVRFIQSA